MRPQEAASQPSKIQLPSKVAMQGRQQHLPEVRAFLQRRFSSHHWEFAFPQGSGNETYLAHGNERTYFVKLGAQIATYQAMASIGLTPEVLAVGLLEDGTAVVVQPAIAGRRPSWRDYRTHLEQVATTIRQMHHSPEVQQVLPEAASTLHRDVGLQWLTCIQQRWESHREQVPEMAEFVDESLAHLARQVQTFRGTGLVASHNDICNANWLLTAGGRLYLVDLDSMAMEDPAIDVGATLWWYYPPALRPRFLEIAGYADDEPFQFRMRVRMAMHCLHIILPRERSFDEFDPASFAEALTDFRAIVAGRENPQGYDE
jgi:thiamine kinase-like enzyme